MAVSTLFSSSNAPSSFSAVSNTNPISTTSSIPPSSLFPSTTTSPFQSTTNPPSVLPLSSQTTTTPITILSTLSSTLTTTSTRNLTYTGPFTHSRSSASSSSTPTSYPAKRGLAYTNVTTLIYWPPPSPYITWAYNYYSLPNASNNIGPYPYPSSPYRFIPLLFNDNPSLTSVWSANVNFSIANYGTDAIFGFNEPDASFGGFSSNMNVSQSIKGYQNFMQPFAGRVKIGAPAVTNAGGGLTYLSQFLGNASRQNANLTVDFINIHWYASPYNIAYFESYLQQALNLSILYSPNITSSFVPTSSGGVLPIWITEFGMDQNFYDLNTTVQFLKNASSFMDSQSWVERYAWFGDFPEGYTQYNTVATNMLLNVDGSGRSVLGDAYYGYNGTN